MTDSTSITTADHLAPGSLVVLDSQDWVRVTETSGIGPFTSTVARVGVWERRWIRTRGAIRAVRYAWQRRVWWPVVDWADDRREARRRR